MAQPKFSRKAVPVATNQENQVADGAWDAWNKHRHERCPFQGLDSKGKNIKEGVGIARVNLIFEMGYPSVNVKDGKALQYWDTRVALPEGDEEYSKEELEQMAKFPDSKYVWFLEWDDDAKKKIEKRKQASPYRAQREVGICIDVPSWTVDYGKHPYAESDEPDFRPVRISLNGEWAKNIQKSMVFGLEYDKKLRKEVVNDRTLLYKIAQQCGLEDEYVAAGADVIPLAEATCNFKIKSVLNTKKSDDGSESIFLNISASSPTTIQPQTFRGETITVEEQIEEALKDSNISEFTGILLDMEEYDDSMFEMLGVTDHFHFVKRAQTSKTWELTGTKDGNAWSFEKGIEYSDTPFSKAYEKWLESKGNTSTQKSVDKPVTVVKGKPKQVVKEPVKVVSEPMGADDWSDDMPFSPIGLQYPALLLCM